MTSTPGDPRAEHVTREAELGRHRAQGLHPKGFVFAGEDDRAVLRCHALPGFEKLLAALGTRQGVRGLRLTVVGPNLALADWLEAWSEDARPRRTVVVTRVAGGPAIKIGAELSVYGRSVEVVLAVTSAALV